MSNASIGAIGAPYYDLVNDRTKGFVTHLHKNVDEIEATLQGALTREQRGSRITLRIWADASLNYNELNTVRTLRLEAVVPVQGIGQIVYYGWNELGRRSESSVLCTQRKLLEEVQERTSRNCLLLPDYSICFTQHQARDFTDADVEQLVQIYAQTFNSYLVELNAVAVRGMLAGNWVAVVRNPEQQIVAVVMAELAMLKVEGKSLRLAEISEVATHPDYKRRGLARAAYWKVVRALRKEGVEAIFTETRANHYAIMAVAWDVGLRPRGTLHQHCVISSEYSEVPQLSTYGDLVVFS